MYQISVNSKMAERPMNNPINLFMEGVEHIGITIQVFGLSRCALVYINLAGSTHWGRLSWLVEFRMDLTYWSTHSHSRACMPWIFNPC